MTGVAVRFRCFCTCKCYALLNEDVQPFTLCGPCRAAASEEGGPRHPHQLPAPVSVSLAPITDPDDPGPLEDDDEDFDPADEQWDEMAAEMEEAAALAEEEADHAPEEDICPYCNDVTTPLDPCGCGIPERTA